MMAAMAPKMVSGHFGPRPFRSLANLDSFKAARAPGSEATLGRARMVLGLRPANLAEGRSRVLGFGLCRRTEVSEDRSGGDPENYS